MSFRCVLCSNELELCATDVPTRAGPLMRWRCPNVNCVAHKPDFYAQQQQAADDYPDNNPKTVHGLAKAPLHLVPTRILYWLAEAFGNGAKKYGPFNWREKKISASIYYAAAMRHLTAWYEREDLAEDSGVHHLAHAAACLAMIADTEGTELFNDDRPPKRPTRSV